MTLTTDSFTIDDLELSQPGGFPAVEDCQRVLYGVQPGVSSPRSSLVSEHRRVGCLYGVRGYDL